MSPEALPCALADRCGGCPQMAHDRAAQEADRRAHIERLLQRPVDRTHASPRWLGYRARVLLRPDPTTGRAGYHAARSSAHIPIAACPIARPELEAILADLPPLPPGLDGIELRSDGARVVLAARTRRRHGPQKHNKQRRPALRPDTLREALRGVPLAGSARDGAPIQGDARTQLTVAGVAHTLRPDTFYQVNLEINALLVERVIAAVREASPARVLDLYAGAGNLSLPLAAAGIPVTLIELAPSSVADARDAAARLSPAVAARVEIRQADAGAFQAGDAFFDVAILDPPRAGAPGVLDQLLLTRPARVAYVACNPGALARDIRPLLRAGYQISSLEFFDMFPHTHHAEALCILDRP